jgi:hypothetical protein
MQWLRKEWRIQWPLVRFEFYKWGAVALAGIMLSLVAKVLHGILKIPDAYVYISLFITSCACFASFISKLSPIKGTSPSPAAQSTESVTALATALPPSVQQMNDYYHSLDVAFIHEVEIFINGEIEKIPEGPERDNFIMQGLISTSVTWQLDQVWYGIYGSQIKALELRFSPTC